MGKNIARKKKKKQGDTITGNKKPMKGPYNKKNRQGDNTRKTYSREGRRSDRSLPKRENNCKQRQKHRKKAKKSKKNSEEKKQKKRTPNKDNINWYKSYCFFFNPKSGMWEALHETLSDDATSNGERNSQVEDLRHCEIPLDLTQLELTYLLEWIDVNGRAKFYKRCLFCSDQSSSKEIRSNYRKLVLRVHPDKVPNNLSQQANLAFSIIKKAYDIMQ